jgi:hypothetical protein
MKAITFSKPTARGGLSGNQNRYRSAGDAGRSQAGRGEKTFDDARFVNQIPARKHDHFLIPAGTVHCSGSGTMVLEISATPYIFTFKLWDWGRLG